MKDAHEQKCSKEELGLRARKVHKSKKCSEKELGLRDKQTLKSENAQKTP